MSTKTYLASFVKRLADSPYLILDTETTGLRNAEICQIAIINSEGKTLLDTLVKTTKPIPSDATAVHKISNETVANAPMWKEVSRDVKDIVSNQLVVIYNQDFDVHMLYSSDLHRADEWSWGWDEIALDYLCAMKAFSVHYGDWNNYRRSYRWKPLSVAAQKLKVPVQDAHSALGDCLMTLGVVRGLIVAHGKGK